MPLMALSSMAFASGRILANSVMGSTMHGGGHCLPSCTSFFSLKFKGFNDTMDFKPRNALWPHLFRYSYVSQGIGQHLLPNDVAIQN